MEMTTMELLWAAAPIFVSGVAILTLFRTPRLTLTYEDHEHLRQFIHHEVYKYLAEKQQDKLFTTMNDIIFSELKDEDR